MAPETRAKLPEALPVECLDRRKLRVFLERRRQGEPARGSGEVRLEELLRENLARAQELIPSGSGVLLLDNPITKQRDRRENELVVVASISQGTGTNPYPPGRTIPVYGNTIGNVYLTGQPYLGLQSEANENASMVAVPVYIEKEVCGVLLLRNRIGGKEYHERDQQLLAIFSDYMSSVIVNVLDAEWARELSVRDGLTGLYNDRYFHAQLSKAIVVADESGEDLSLVFMDLDHFKHVNDTHGHLAGSMVLREVGGILKNIASLPDATLTRYGGDEFVFIFPRIHAEAAQGVCEQVRREIEGHTFLRVEGPYGPPLHIRGIITCSTGVASYHEHVRKRFSIEQNKDAFLKLADRAMYAAKERGKNCVVVSDKEGE
ncbi:MAG: sensor domain-containing diguanylate cyclase [Bdellovibrionota bacterium]